MALFIFYFLDEYRFKWLSEMARFISIFIFERDFLEPLWSCQERVKVSSLENGVDDK